MMETEVTNARPHHFGKMPPSDRRTRVRGPDEQEEQEQAADFPGTNPRADPIHSNFTPSAKLAGSNRARADPVSVELELERESRRYLGGPFSVCARGVLPLLSRVRSASGPKPIRARPRLWEDSRAIRFR